MTTSEPESGRRPATDAEARALASTVRLRILRACLGEPHTNKEIAEALGKDPATVLHHVRTLVDTGFLAPQSPRRGARGSREIPYVATRKSWQMETPAKDSVMLTAFLEEVALVPVEEVDTMRAGLRLRRDRKEELSRRFTELVEEYFDDDDPDGEPWSVFLAVHPDPNRH